MVSATAGDSYGFELEGNQVVLLAPEQIRFVEIFQRDISSTWIRLPSDPLIFSLLTDRVVLVTLSETRLFES